MTYRGKQIIIKDRIFRRCPECERYIGDVRCRYCGKRYRTPRGLFGHEAHCFGNPNGTCKHYGIPWSECDGHGTKCGPAPGDPIEYGPPCLRYTWEDRLHTPIDQNIDMHEMLERDRLRVLAEIDATTVKAGDPA